MNRGSVVSVGVGVGVCYLPARGQRVFSEGLAQHQQVRLHLVHLPHRPVGQAWDIVSVIVQKRRAEREGGCEVREKQHRYAKQPPTKPHLCEQGVELAFQSPRVGPAVVPRKGSERRLLGVQRVFQRYRFDLGR